MNGKLIVNIWRRNTDETESICRYLPVDERTVRKSLSATSGFRDIEDAMQHYAALQTGCDAIVTRNVKDFTQADIPVYTPDEFLAKEV